MFKTNEYFEGKVISIAFQAQQKPATIGVMATGEYVINTDEKEKMTVVTGKLTITFENQSSENTYTDGQSFEVAADSSFNVKVDSETAYLCEYG